MIVTMESKENNGNPTTLDNLFCFKHILLTKKPTGLDRARVPCKSSKKKKLLTTSQMYPQQVKLVR